MVNTHHKLFFFLSPTVSLLKVWWWGVEESLYCDPPIQDPIICTKLKLPGKILLILYEVTCYYGCSLKNKTKKASYGKYTPAVLKQEEKAKLCLKSGPFDPWTFSPFPAGFSKSHNDRDPTPTATHEHKQMVADFQEAGLWLCYYGETKRNSTKMVHKEVLYDGGQWFNYSHLSYLVLWNRMPLTRISLQKKKSS